MTDPNSKPFMEHLDDLRWVVVKSAVVLAIAITVCFFYTTELLDLLYWPLRQAGQDPTKIAIVLHPADPFFIQMQVCLMGGIIAALPFILYFIAGFILPALTDREKKYLAPVFTAGAVLFVGGILFCYFLVLPQTLAFFVDYNKMLGVQAMWTLDNYIDFTVQLLLGLGLAFEFPLVIMLLNILGIVSSQMLSQHRRHAILIVVVIAACITPSSDPYSLTVVAVPLYVLYEACVWVTLAREKSSKKPAVVETETDAYPE